MNAKDSGRPLASLRRSIERCEKKAGERFPRPNFQPGGLRWTRRCTPIDAADRLPEIIAACRAELAWFRNHWIVRLTVDLEAEWEMGPEGRKETAEDEFEQHVAEARDYVERRREYRAFRERLRDYRIRQESGEEPPSENAPPTPER